MASDPHWKDQLEQASDGTSDVEDIADIEEINALTELGTTLIQAILEREPLENIQDLIDAGTPLWFQDDEGISPLHAAAYVANEKLIKMFLDDGAVWNAGESVGCYSRRSFSDLAGYSSGQLRNHCRRYSIVHE